MKPILSTISLLIYLTGIAQNKITGYIVKDDGSPTAYVNIGIRAKNIGTTSNQKGFFMIDVADINMNDSLTLSHVGYKELVLSLNKFEANKVYVLTPASTQLKEIKIYSKKPVIKVLGIKSYSPFLFSPPIDKKSDDIPEFVQLITLKMPSKISSASIMIRDCKKIDSAKFRINFYTNNQGLPGNIIHSPEVFITSLISKGWIKFDLDDFNIRFDDDFFIGFELLPDIKNPVITYGSRLGGNIIARHSSLGAWEKNIGASLSAYVTVQQ